MLGLVARADRALRPEGRPSQRTTALVGGLLALELLAWTLARLPAAARFENFWFQDHGANLTVQTLLAQGERPQIDFLYWYGLLALAAARGWFSVIGRTPWAYVAAVGVVQVAIGLALGRFVVAAREGLPGLLLGLASLPIVVPPTYPNLAHGLEAVALVMALGSQLGGRMGGAIGWAAVALLIKPSMAYVYIAWLVLALALARGWWRRPGTWATLRGPIVAWAGLALALGAGFGPRVLVETLLPMRVAATYRGTGFGFFHGQGRAFWMPPGATIGHYLGTPRGFWIVASLVLMGAGLVRLAVRLRDRESPQDLADGQVVLTCAVMHTAFVTLFFGNAMSWLYYAYLLVLGIVPLASYRVGGRAVGVGVVLGVALASLIVDRTLPREVADTWRLANGSTRLDGLWTSPELAAEWRNVRGQVDASGGRAVLVAFSGAAATFEPGRFTAPVGMFLMPGMENALEPRRKAAQIRASRVVVCVGDPLLPDDGAAFLAASRPLREALELFRPVWTGRFFTVLKRPEAPDTAR